MFYRVEVDPTESFDNPIVQDFQCPPSNKRTEWEIETSVVGDGVISGGSFTLELEVDGYTFNTAEIPYDSVALASNETGISDIIWFSLFDPAHCLESSTEPLQEWDHGWGSVVP